MQGNASQPPMCQFRVSVQLTACIPARTAHNTAVCCLQPVWCCCSSSSDVTMPDLLVDLVRIQLPRQALHPRVEDAVRARLTLPLLAQAREDGGNHGQQDEHGAQAEAVGDVGGHQEKQQQQDAQWAQHHQPFHHPARHSLALGQRDHLVLPALRGGGQLRRLVVLLLVIVVTAAARTRRQHGAHKGRVGRRAVGYHQHRVSFSQLD
mmetsp:Transcript_5151/g.12668  ORF Transcript_5151/g.12668 Transcript_5151/m.12668 type:complete len:207 (+) Transcript_5151:181-801(+)